MQTGLGTANKPPMRAAFQRALRRFPSRALAAGISPNVRLDIEVWGQRVLVLVLLAWATSFFIGFTSALSILAMLGFVCAILGLRIPALGLFGISMLATLDPLNRVYLLTGGLFRWNTFNYWLVLVMALTFPWILRLKDPHSRLLQFFILLLGLETLISTRRMEGIQDILNLVSTFGLVIYFTRASKEYSKFYWMGIINGTLAAVGGGIFYLQKINLPYIDPNAFAFFPLTAIFAICLSFLHVQEHPRIKLYLIVLAGVNYGWIFLSGSRGNMLSGLFCLIFLFLMTRSLTWRTILLTAVILLGYGLSISFLEQQTYSLGRLDRMLDPDFTLSERTSGRSILAQGGWQIFLDHPLGIGTGGFRDEVASRDLYQGRSTPAHSGWIKVLAENGFPGFLILFAYVFSFAWVGWRRRKQDLLLLGVLVTISFAVSFLSVEYQGKTVWFLGAGVAAFLHHEEYLKAAVELGKRKSRWKPRRVRGDQHVED